MDSAIKKASIKSRSFNCPHQDCGVLAHQFWFTVHLDELADSKLPLNYTTADLEEFKPSGFDEETRKREEELYQFITRLAQGKPFREPHRATRDFDLLNVSISQCYSCKNHAIWVYDRIVWPDSDIVMIPNEDLPDEIKSDFMEAAEILQKSPRGSAALLRLCIQKLVKHLGEEGKNINHDIACLVKKGLDARVQKALDIVRVVGNDAVHPGTIDIRDDRATAEKLFSALNFIANSMITLPRQIDDMYEKLPSTKKEQIARRDTKGSE